MHLKSRMHPTAQHARSINGQQSSLDQERNHARAKQLLQPRVITGKMRVCRATLFLSEFASEFSSAHHMKPSLAIKQAVGYQRVQLTDRLHKHAMSPLQPAEDDIRAIVDLETSAWDRLDADALVDLFHPDTVWPWPPNSAAHDPEHWVMPLGRFNRARWKAGWESLFSAYELVHNRRQTIRIQVSKEQDGAFAVVDVDTLWRHKETRAEQRWVGRSCKVYTKVNERWFFIHQTGLLEYTR